MSGFITYPRTLGRYHPARHIWMLQQRLRVLRGMRRGRYVPCAVVGHYAWLYCFLWPIFAGDCPDDECPDILRMRYQWALDELLTISHECLTDWYQDLDDLFEEDMDDAGCIRRWHVNLQCFASQPELIHFEVPQECEVDLLWAEKPVSEDCLQGHQEQWEESCVAALCDGFTRLFSELRRRYRQGESVLIEDDTLWHSLLRADEMLDQTVFISHPCLIEATLWAGLHSQSPQRHGLCELLGAGWQQRYPELSLAMLFCRGDSNALRRALNSPSSCPIHTLRQRWARARLAGDAEKARSLLEQLAESGVDHFVLFAGKYCF